jgi:GTP-dependent phosphoenolpyruvate carboxykinase
MSNRPTIRKPAPAHIQHERLRLWVAEIAALTQPDRIYFLRLKPELLTLRVQHDAA